MTKKYKLSLLFLACIFILGLFLRTYRLGLNAPALYADEVGHYFYFDALKNHSVSILRQIVYLFFSATWLVSLNPLGVRLASALFGALSIIAGFYFAKSVHKQSGSNLYLRVGLAFAFLVCILPWNISISRLGHTHIPIVVFTSLLHITLYLSARSLVQKLLSFIPFLIGAYYYPIFILMSPLILLLPIKELFLDNKKNKKQIFLFGFIFASLVLGFLVSKYQVFNTSSRGLDLAIWRDVNVTANSNLYRGIARESEPSIFSFGKNTEEISNKLLFNFPLSVVESFSKNYLSFFSIDFLFLRGDPVLRHSTGMVGSFYLFLLPFLLYGIYKFYQVADNRTKTLITLWLIASPIPAAITKDGAGYLLRAIVLMPLLTYFCSVGLVYSLEFFKGMFFKLTYLVCLGFICLFSAYYYFFGYFHIYPALSAKSFEYGFRELTQFQSANPGKLLMIWEDRYPYAHFCFWLNLSSETCHPKNIDRRENLGSSRVDLPLPNTLFSLPVNEWDLAAIVKKYQISYVALPEHYSKNFPNFFLPLTPVETILNPDNSIAFSIYSLQKDQ